MILRFMNINVLARSRKCLGLGHYSSHVRQGKKMNECSGLPCCAPGTVLREMPAILFNHQRNPFVVDIVVFKEETEARKNYVPVAKPAC